MEGTEVTVISDVKLPLVRRRILRVKFLDSNDMLELGPSQATQGVHLKRQHFIACESCDYFLK